MIRPELVDIDHISTPEAPGLNRSLDHQNVPGAANIFADARRRELV